LKILRKGEFRFLKSKFRNVRQSNHAQGQKRLPSAAQNQFQQFNENWRDKNNQRVNLEKAKRKPFLLL